MTLDGFTASVSVLAAIFSGVAAWLSYRLARSIRDELKSDEVLIAGVLHKPALGHPDYSDRVLQTTLFNKSKRKAFIHKLRAFNSKGERIPVAWADRMDHLGNVEGGSRLIGLVDSAQIFVRNIDGKFRDTSIHISHSFSSEPLILFYDSSTLGDEED